MAVKLHFLTERCKGCALCVSACPRRIIRIDHSSLNQKGYHTAVVTDPDKCTGCAFCALMCPDCVIIIEKEG